MAKEFFIRIGKEQIPVTEEVYRAFKRPAWTERKRREVRAEMERSLEVFMDDGFDIPSEQALVDEIVADKLLLDELYAALAELTEDERSLIDALYFDEKSEREFSKETGLPQKTINNRKLAILKKLKNFSHNNLAQPPPYFPLDSEGVFLFPVGAETEVINLIGKNNRAALYQSQGAETAEEIIGVLTAISVVSKRMAKKLALLEQRPAEKEGVRKNAKTTAVSPDAG